MSATEHFTFFYGGPFSNWARSPFVVDGVCYERMELFMMVAKARLFGDAEAEQRIMATTDPKLAKSIGRRVRGFDKAVWDAKARDIVYKGCHAKFTQNADCREALMATRGTTLVEASPTDQIWGIGLSEHDERAKDRRKWCGTNWLGEVLTLVREDIAAGVCRTDNFGWSGTATVNDDVTVVDQTVSKLDIWDYDGIRRKACDLKLADPAVERVTAYVGEYARNREGPILKTVSLVAVRAGVEYAAVVAHQELMTATEAAIEKVRYQVSPRL